MIKKELEMIKKNLPKRVGDFKVLWDINDAVSPILGVPLLTDLDVDTFPELPLLLCTLLLLADLPSEIKRNVSSKSWFLLE